MLSKFVGKVRKMDPLAAMSPGKMNENWIVITGR
jgi:hypothetical protein